jgi:hypothetical protein
MAQYALVSDIEARLGRTFDTTETNICTSLLTEAADIIDAYNTNATTGAKKIVSIRVVSRAIGTSDVDVPIGATQGSMSALGYSQSWTQGAGASTGEVYLGKLEKKILGVGDKIGSYSPTQELVPQPIIPEVF